MTLTLIVDREFPGVGRVKKATGTTIPAVRKKMNRMLTEFYETGRIDLLREIRDNRLTLMEALDAWQRKALDALATGPTAQRLGTVMLAWIDKQEPDVDYSAKHLESMRDSLGYLLSVDADAVVNDLPALLETLRDTVGKAHQRTFNLVRAHASAYVRATLKRKHPLWAAIQSVEPRRVPKRAPRPELTPEWMRNTFPRPESSPLDAGAWAMALTGMGPKEYWGEWSTGADRIRINGTKRNGRVRVVPLVQAVAVSRISRNAFRLRLQRRMKGFIGMYDFRRTFSRWMESAGILRARRKMYMGHAGGDVTSLYEAHEITAHLAADATRMRTFLEIPEPTTPTLTAVK